MASGNVHGANDPLLGKPGKAQSDGPLQPVSTNAHTALKALAIIRIATGAACLAAPRFTCALFKYNVPVEQTLLVRMFGVRDAVLGELLITAENKNASDGGRR